MSNHQFPKRNEWAQNGFLDKSESTIAFDSGTRTFTITPTGNRFRYYDDGEIFSKPHAESIIITNTEGYHVIYYVGPVLTVAANPTHSQTESVITDTCIVAYVIWNADQSEGVLLEERHGHKMGTFTHRWAHETMGMRYGYGYELGNITVDGVGDKGDTQFSLAIGENYDEDLAISSNAIATGAELQIWFRRGSNWRYRKNNAYRGLTSQAGQRMAYDNAGTLAELGNIKFGLMHCYGMNGMEGSPIMIVGQNEYSTISGAREGANTEVAGITITSVPFSELKPLYSFIYQAAGYSNDLKARLRSTDTGADAVDHRKQDLSGAAVGVDLSNYVTKAALASNVVSAQATITNLRASTCIASYLNFGLTRGRLGWGLRGKGGNVEFKNNAGTWAAIT